METIKVWICDDDKFAVGAVEGAVVSALEKYGLHAETSLFSNGAELLEAFRQGSCDLCLLDIDMPGQDGIRCAEQIRKDKAETEIVFVSNCENRVFDSFQAEPIAFVRKNKFFSDMTAAIKTYMGRRSKRKRTLAVKCKGEIVNVLIDDIEYIEGALAKQHIHIKGQSGFYVISSSMKALEEALEEYGFLRIHNGYLIDLLSVSVIRNHEVEMKSGTVLPMARGRAQQTREKFLEAMHKSGNITF